MQLRAPAKVNLSLRILHRRADGFHEIETVMSPVSLYDELTIEHSDQRHGIIFQCDDPSLATAGENLVVRAAELFFSTTKRNPAVRISLRKNIPHGAGLGGGSSDAAATLVGLNELFETNWSRDKLAEFAAQLGSDVPFFLHGGSAVCSGRGEIVRPVKLATNLPLLLVKPDFGIPTAWAYSCWENSREVPAVFYAEQEVAGITLVNDLERPVFEKFIFLVQLKMWLRRQPEVGAALLSGSGSTVFAVLKDKSAANELSRRLRNDLDPQLWTCACETWESAVPSAP